MADEPVVGASTLLGTNHLQTSVDALKQTIDHLNQSLSGLIPQLQQSNRYARAGGMGGTGAGAYPSGMFWGRNGGQPSSGGQQGRTANGGGATFGGKAGGGGGGSGGSGGDGGDGQGGEDDPKKKGIFGRLSQTAGGKAGMAVGAAYGANAAMNKLVQPGIPGMLNFDMVSAQLSLGGATTRQAVQQNMKGQATGLNSADVAQGQYTLTRGLGILPGTTTDKRMQSAIGIAGMINPSMGNAQIASAAQAVGQPEYTIKLRGLGIGPKNGAPSDPATLARDILNQIRNWQSINTPEQITSQMDNPNGAVAVTLRNYVAQGFLPPETADVVKDEIRAILIARMNGMNFETLQQLGSDVNSPNKSTRDAAQKALQKAGVYNPTQVQKAKNKATTQRDRDISMTDSFVEGAGVATDALAMFTNAINTFLDKTGLGSAIGWVAGAKAGVTSGGGGNGSDIGAMGNQGYATGGQPNDGMGNSSQGVTLSTTSLGNGANKASGAPGTQSGSAKPSAGKKTIRFIRPVAGPITSGFGSRKDPLNGRTKIHTGVDFGVGTGTPIHASASGTIVFSGSRGAGYWAGNHVIIDHGGGYQTLYAHQSRVKARVGSTVQQGEVIGYSGATGRVTGPHLHFEIHINGHPVDPMPYLSGSSVAISDSKVSPSSQGSSTAGSSTGTSSTSSTPQVTTAPGGSGAGVITSELQALQGFSGAGASSTTTNTGSATQDTTANTSSSSSNNASSGTSGSKTPTAPSSASGNQAIVKQMAAAKGWTGAQWDALYQLVMHESGFKNTAQNPTSTAFGLFQFLNSTWSGSGVSKTSDPRGQTQAGLAYIAKVYGNPANAWAKWQARSPHWYDTGAWDVPKDESAVVHQGEMIIPAKEARQIREVLLNGTPYKASQIASGAGGVQITIQKGAITVTANGGVTASGINDLGKAIADGIAQNDKIKKLQQGVLT